mgnify:FL=1
MCEETGENPDVQALQVIGFNYLKIYKTEVSYQKISFIMVN